EGQRFQLASLSDRVPQLNDGIRRSLKAAASGSTASEMKLAASANTAVSGGSDFLQFVDQELVRPKGVSVTARQYYDKSTAVIAEYFRLFDASAEGLADGLGSRSSRLRKEQLANTGVALVFLLMGGLVALSLSSAIRKQIGALNKLFRQV